MPGDTLGVFDIVRVRYAVVCAARVGALFRVTRRLVCACRALLLLAVAAQAAALSIGVQSTAHVCRPQLVLSQTPQLCRSTASRHADVLMAVPKKRQSKMKTRQRKANWFAKARRSATLALSRAKSAKYNPLEDPKYAFSSPDDEEEDDEDDDEEE